MNSATTKYLLGCLVGSLLSFGAAKGLANDPDQGMKAVDALSTKAGVEIKQGGLGRVGGSDIDTPDKSVSDVNKIKAAAKSEGYEVIERADSITIKGTGKSGQTIKETTIHIKPGHQDTVGSSSRDAQNASNDPEHFKGRPDPKTGRTATDPATGNVKPTVSDLLGKTATDTHGNPLPGEHPFNKKPSTMTQTDIKDLGKTTSKVMETGNVNDPVLKAKADALRNGATPEQAGIKDMQAFQNESKAAAVKAVQNENAQIANEQGQIKSEINAATENLNKAKASGDPEAIAKSKAQVENVRSKAIDYNSRVQGAQQSAANNGATDVYAEANGYAKVTTPDGQTRYVHPETGKTMTPSQTMESISRGNRINLVSSGKSTVKPVAEAPVSSPEVAKPGGGTTHKMLDVGGKVLMVGAVLKTTYDVATSKEGEERAKTAGGSAAAWGVGTATGLGTGALVVAIGGGPITATAVAIGASIYAGGKAAQATVNKIDEAIHGEEKKSLADERTAAAGSEGWFIQKGFPPDQAKAFADRLVKASNENTGNTAIWKDVKAALKQIEADKAEKTAADLKSAEGKTPADSDTSKTPGSSADSTKQPTGGEGDSPKTTAITEAASPTAEGPGDNVAPGAEQAPPVDKRLDTSSRTHKKDTDKDKPEKEKKKPTTKKGIQQTPTSKPAASTPPENAGQTIEKGWVESKSGRTTVSHTYDSQGNLIAVTETDTDPSGKVIGVRTYPGQGGPASTSGGGGYDPLADPALQGKKPIGTSSQIATKAGDFQKGQWAGQDQQGKTAGQAGSPYVTAQSPDYTTPFGSTPGTTTKGTTQQGATTEPNTQSTSSGGLSDVVVSSQTITVSVWDHGTVDGDIVNITLNGTSVAGGVTLAASPRTFTLNLNPGRNSISIYAVNEGTVAPNTASIKISHVTSGKAEQTYSINQKTSASFAATVDTATSQQR